MLYSAALEYESALKDYKNARTELSNSITDGYDNYIETRKAYLTAKEELEELQNKLIYDEALNALGQLSFEEYEGELTEYENARTALKDALSLYSSTLYQYDRTTCGGASSFFTEESISTQVGNAGLGTPEEDSGNIDDDLSKLDITVEKGAIYSIRPVVDGEEFMLYIDIPDDFEYNITHFELWSDNRQIGTTTPKGEAIKHLTITVKEVSSVFIRLYDNDTFIDDCSIDPEVSVGPLNIKKASLPEAEDESKVIGSYTVEEDTNTDMIKLRFTFDTKAVEKNFALGSAVKYYNLSVEQNLFLFSNDLVPQDQPFSYMSFIKNDLGKLTIRMFAEDGSYIGGADFDTKTKKLIANVGVTEADMQELAAREIVKKQKAADLQAERDRVQDMYNAAVDAGGSEGGDTIAYYKERLAELDEQIKAVGDTVTDEEIQKALTDNAAEVAALVDKMNREASTEEAINAGLTAEEIAARNTILENAAEKVIREKKKQERLDDIEKSLRDKEKELAAKLAAANGSGKTRIEIIKENEEIEALQKEIDLLKAQRDSVAAGENEISREEISQALLEYGDEIYAAAADQLSDAMLYGSETGQWAIAYLESQGLEVNNENMRKLVEQADQIKLYEAYKERKAILEKEIEEVKDKIRKLNNAQTSDTTDGNLKKQLNNILTAYEAELDKTTRAMLKCDPAKKVKLKASRDELEALKAKKAADESARAGLISVKYSRDAYIAAEKNEYDRQAANLGPATDAINMWADRREKELKEEIELLEERLNNPLNKPLYENNMNTCKRSLEEIRDKIAMLEQKIEKTKKILAKFSAFTSYAFESELRAYENALAGQMNREAEITELMERLDKEYNPDEIRKKLDADRTELNSLPAVKTLKTSLLKAKCELAASALKDKEKEWDDSSAKKQEYDSNIDGYTKRITELEELISMYY